MKNVVWTKGTSGLEGEFQSASEVDFYVDKVVCDGNLCDDFAFGSVPSGQVHSIVWLVIAGHDPHRGHESRSQIRRLLHPPDSQV